MRAVKIAGWLWSLTFYLFASAQELQHEVKVINIEVPVRVFRGEAFVDDLKLEDFELEEDGVPQKIESVYLVKKTSIEREEGQRNVNPQTQRTFVFLFQMTEYLPEVEKAIDFFFENVFSSHDCLIVITPVKTYNLKNDILARMPREKIEEQLVGILRSDIILGGTEYRNLVRQLEESAPTDEEGLQLYLQLLDRLESLRAIDQKKLQEFAGFLKSRPGQKHCYFFYQKELIPKLHPGTRVELDSLNQEQMSFLMDLVAIFDHFKRDISFDVNLIKNTFSDSSISVHFMYITKTPPPRIDMASLRPSGLVMAEQSEDIFSAFREVARATGGVSESSADASAAFRKAAEASENYYLLYYKPDPGKEEGKFREIKVRVKKGNCTVTHRAGYFAN